MATTETTGWRTPGEQQLPRPLKKTRSEFERLSHHGYHAGEAYDNTAQRSSYVLHNHAHLTQAGKN